jgi:predicted permease
VSPTLNGDAGRLPRLGRIRFSLGKSLAISQVALSLILLMGAGLFIRTLHNLRSQDLGFDRERLLVVWTAPGQTGRKGPALANLQRTIRERISALPGVISASQSSTGLLNSNYYWINGTERLAAQGQLPKPGGKWTLSMAAPKFFETAGIPLLVGRDFTEQDTTRAFNDNVAIINSSLARFLFEDGNPVGQRLDLGNGAHTTVEIVGVASDAKSVSPRDRNLGMIYLSTLQSQIGNDLCLVVRTAGVPEGLVSSLRKEFQDIDATLPVLRIMTIEQQLDETLASERLIAKFTAFFSALAVLLACLGLYGVISYTASRRTGEMGLRLALGASRSDVLSMILGESMWLVIAGLVIGVAVILSSSRLIASALYGVSPADPLTITAAIALMAGVALLAALLPARRASRVDPMVALRYE